MVWQVKEFALHCVNLLEAAPSLGQNLSQVEGAIKFKKELVLSYIADRVDCSLALLLKQNSTRSIKANC